MATFGNRPEDAVTDSKGNVRVGLAIAVYASEADANAQVSQLAQGVTGTDGRWPVDVTGHSVVWAREPNGRVYPVGSEDMSVDHEARLAAVESELPDKIDLATANSTYAQLDTVPAAYEPAASTLRAAGQTAAQINTFLAAASPLGVKKLIGAFSVSSILTLGTAGLHVDLSAATITTSVSSGYAVEITGSGVTVHGGEIVSPATWDGANVQPTKAVVHVTGSGATVRDLTLTNVPKVGIYADDTDDAMVTGCRITGNYPAGSWTGVETGHFGIAVNPGTSGRSGRTVISGNLIRSCVQGVFLGNYGTTATGAAGASIAGNVFDGCHNHGIYNAGGVDGCAVSGNTFSRCSLPIALTGTAHSVTGNTLWTSGTGNNLDLVGISLREAVDCAVTGNTIKGDAPAASVIIDVANFTGTSVRGNVVANNTIDVAGGTSSGIRVGRTGQTTDCSDNVVANNTIRSAGNVGVGLITLGGSAGFGNKITGNQIVVKGETHGIFVQNVSHTTVQGNSIRFEYDAPSAKTLGGVVMNATTYCTVSLNDIHAPATFGTNVALRGVWETGAASKNRVIQNGYHGDLTKLTSFTPIVLISSSDAYLDERGNGDPNGAFFGAPGSRWSRQDGGAATSLYVKETANTSATWAAK